MIRRSLVLAPLAVGVAGTWFGFSGVAASRTGGNAEATAVVAQLTLVAPPSGTDLEYTVENLSAASPNGPQQIKTIVLDCFPGYGGRSLTVDSVAIGAPPPGGTATVAVGNHTSDRGPAVLTFTGFNDGESMTFTPDLDNYLDPNQAVNRANTRGCRAEVIFSGTLRGAGRADLNTDTDEIVIDVKQTRPAP